MRPIHESDGEGHYWEFFRPEFASQRLGKLGKWQGGAAARLGLENPVQPDVFAKLLKGRTPEGERLAGNPLTEGNRERGWQFALTEEGGQSVLWALSPKLIRGRIQLAHNRAVQAAVAEFERSLNGSPWIDNPYAPGRKLTLFAKFQSGATREQVPRLETNLVLFNFIIQRSGGIGSFTAEELLQQQARMESIYKQVLQREVVRILGDEVRLPNELCARLQSQSAASTTKSRYSARAQPLRGEELFGAWQEQARNWGWGTEKVEKILVEARSQPNWRNWAEDWKTILRVGSVRMHQTVQSAKEIIDRTAMNHQSKQPEPPKKQDRDKGISESY